jgi:hypothetical protein
MTPGCAHPVIGAVQFRTPGVRSICGPRAILPALLGERGDGKHRNEPGEQRESFSRDQ